MREAINHQAPSGAISLHEPELAKRVAPLTHLDERHMLRVLPR